MTGTEPNKGGVSTTSASAESLVEKNNRLVKENHGLVEENRLYFKIKKGDRIVGDSGYEDEPSKIVVMRDEHSKKFKKFLARVCSRQETFFKGLKD